MASKPKEYKAGTKTMPENTGQFGKGNPGKPKGAVNKNTKALKDMILGALNDAGGQAYLLQQAKEQPTAFMTLIGKVLPMAVNLGDANGEKFTVTFNFVKPGE